MGMRESMEKWASKNQPEVNIASVRQTCDKLKVSGDDYDSCILVTKAFDEGNLNELEFLVGLGEILKKSPDEVEQLLASNQQSVKVSKRYEYRVYDKKLDDQLWTLVHEEDDSAVYTLSPFYITLAPWDLNKHAYVPDNPQDSRWPAILAELEKQTNRSNDAKE